MLTGVYYTVEAALPALLGHGDGGAIVLTSSAAGLTGLRLRFDLMDSGAAGYIAAKHGVVGLMRTFAVELGQLSIRVNSVHPWGVDTVLATVLAFAGDQELPLAHPPCIMQRDDIRNAFFLANPQAGRTQALHGVEMHNIGA